MKKIFSTLVAVVIALSLGLSVAHAATPTVTKVYRTYNSNIYTITLDAGYVTAGPLKSGTNYQTTGGCTLDWYRTSRGKVIIRGVKCVTPGTVVAISPDNPPCDTLFTVRIDSVTVYTDILAPCQPPIVLPPPVTVVQTGATVTFTNPANIPQTGSYLYPVPDAGVYTFAASAPFTATPFEIHSGTAANPTVRYYYRLTVDLTPGQTVTVIQA